MGEHNHSTADREHAYAGCPECQKNRRAEIEADADFWGGTVTWDDDDD